MKSVFVVTERAQVSFVAEVVEKEECDVFAIGLDVEQALEERGVSYISSEPFRTVETPDRLIQAKRLGEYLKQILEEKGCAYKDISVARLYTPTFQYYFSILFYYLDILRVGIADTYAVVYIVEPPISHKDATPFEQLVTRAPHTSLSLLSNTHSIDIQLVPIGSGQVVRRHTERQSLYKTMQLIGLTLLNLFMTYARGRKKISILASEYWKNIKPLMSVCPDAELILLDRSEAVAIGFIAIWKHRMRFVHLDSYVAKKERILLKKKSEELATQWVLTEEEIKSSIVAFKDISLIQVVKEMWETCLSDMYHLLLQIEGTEVLMRKVRPDCVLVRAGISVQTHFGVLCDVAEKRHIPSIENQHGILSGFAGDFTSNPHSKYIASYGALVKEELEKQNFAPNSTFFPVGSPRFDVYSSVSSLHERVSSKTVHVLHIGPPLSPGLWMDSYDVKIYFERLAQACRAISTVHVKIKLRGHDSYEEFYHRCIKDAFGTIPYTIVVTESLATLFETSDIVVSCHSTAYLEALVARRPVIIDATLPIFQSLADTDFAVFEAEGALTVARTTQIYAEALENLARSSTERAVQGEKARSFVTRHFVLGDGRSSDRLAHTIYSLVGK